MVPRQTWQYLGMTKYTENLWGNSGTLAGYEKVRLERFQSSFEL